MNAFNSADVFPKRVGVPNMIPSAPLYEGVITLGQSNGRRENSHPEGDRIHRAERGRK